MNFSRAKTILIFIFIFVNIFLLLIYNFFILEEKTIDNQTLIQVLENNNIIIDEALIEAQEKTLSGVEVINLINDTQGLAASFLGSGYEKESADVYKTSEAVLTVSNQAIEFTVLSPNDKKYNDITVLNAGNKILNTLSNYKFNKSNISVYSVTENSKGDFNVAISYSYANMPVFNHSLYAVAGNKGLKSLKGMVIFFNEIKNRQYDIISVSDVLLDFIDNDDVRNSQSSIYVKDISLGYYLSSNGLEVSTYAIPAYEIELETGKIYYYDARENVDASFKLLESK